MPATGRCRSLCGARTALSDDHAGLQRAIGEVPPEAAWQRCRVHCLRRRPRPPPAQRQRRRPDRTALALRPSRCRRRAPPAPCLDGKTGRQTPTAPHRRARLRAWAEEAIEETRTLHRSPREHPKHLKSTNLLERLNQELKRRTHGVRIFPNAASCRRLIRAPACEQHEEWLDGPGCLDRQPLRDQPKPSLQLAA